MKAKYSLVPCSDDESVAWNEFVDDSPQGTIFADRRFLDTMYYGYRTYWVIRGLERVAALYFDTDDTGTAAGDGHLIYSGLMFSEKLSEDTVQNRNRRFEITELASRWLYENFERVYFRLSPQFEDVRPFSWLNYHSDPSDRYRIDIAYTSYLSIADIDLARAAPEGFFSRMNQLRRRSVRQGLDAKVRTAIEFAPTLLTESLFQLLKAQNETVDEAELSALPGRIQALTEIGVAAQFVTSDRDSTVIYTAVFGWDNKRAYYLYGAPVGDSPAPYQGTMCFVHAFEWLSSRGLKIVDLEGVNSPKRGWFKLSFGGTLVPLYVIRK